MNKRVSTQNKGNNLFKISGTKTLYVYQILVSPIPGFDKKIQIGSAKSLEDALSIIKSYSGSQIKKISEW
jgi:hypothetical protein